MNISENQNSIFPKGERAPADYFTGTVWVQLLVPNDPTLNCQIGNVVFEPGARNYWHKHPGGQILLVTDGIGYYQEKSKHRSCLGKPTEFGNFTGAGVALDPFHHYPQTNNINTMAEHLDHHTLHPKCVLCKHTGTQ